MRKSLLALGVVAAVSAVPASAEYLYGFGGVYLDHQSWNHGPNAIQDGQDGKGRNQFVLGIEGGAGFTWGELYGFYDRESVEKNSSEQKNSFKGSAHVYLGDTGVSLYGQVYHHDNPFQSETNRVLGLGYTALSGDNWFFKPWVGVHDITSWDSFSPNQNVNGNNGYMAGWTARYAFNLGGQNFSFVNWNEIEFDRNDEYAQNQGGKNGLNGALLFNWHATEHLTAAIQYRYFNNKLGVYGSSGSNQQHYGDAIIYRLQYNF
ncbi:outer membrane protein OmpK [Vibrio maritimus]|uniref:outer membrane protein OmpK n=1 Tax=Vibrio maritimus TaxID=990268 RepID=UPI001F47E6A8|nr:outer membrane protein OmpK [Vibrio maritimus]